MATRSTISILDKDTNSITSVYCHWDGYPEHNGQILKDHYNDISKINELMQNGDISSLGETIKDTVFYHRDKGEDKERCSSTTYRVDYDKLTILDVFRLEGEFEDFNYLFDGEWKLLNFNDTTPVLTPLANLV
jgi:hypothetical protein